MKQVDRAVRTALLARTDRRDYPGRANRKLGRIARRAERRAGRALVRDGL